MPPAPKSKTFRICRVCFRWCRIAVWLLILAVVLAVIYIHHFGLPADLKERLQRSAAAQGINLDFAKLRWRWYQGCVAEGFILARTNVASVWRLTANEATLDLGLTELFDKRFRLNSLNVNNATLSWQSRTNSSRVVARGISTEFSLASHDRLVLENFQATVGGIRLGLSGVLTNVSYAQNLFYRPDRPKADLEARMQEVAAWIERIQLNGSSEIDVLFSGDAKAPDEVKGSVKWVFPGGRAPWGSFKRFGGTLELNRARGPDGLPWDSLKFELADAQTPWIRVTNLLVGARVSPIRRDSDVLHGQFEASINSIGTTNARADHVRLNLSLDQPFSNAPPLAVRGKASGFNIVTPWVTFDSVDADLTAKRALPFVSGAGATWGFWARLEPWLIHLKADTTGIKTPKVALDSASFEVDWSAPKMVASWLEARLYRGGIKLGGSLNVETREAAASVELDFDTKEINHLLPEGTQRWLGQFTWATPPRARGEVRLVAPPWTMSRPNWQRDVMPSVKLAGTVSGENGAFRGVPATAAAAEFAFTNDTWRVAFVHATRPEGAIDYSYTGNVLTHDFHFAGRAALDPVALQPLVPEKYRDILKMFAFPTPPEVSGEVTGNWHDHKQTRADLRVFVTNGVFKQTAVNSFQSRVECSNQWIRLTGATALRQGSSMAADVIEVRLGTGHIALSNVLSDVDPLLVAGLMSPVLASNIQPFHLSPPLSIGVNGGFSALDESDRHLRWKVSAGGFAWKKLRSGPLVGRLDWTGSDVLVTNLLIRPPDGTGLASGWASVHRRARGQGVFAASASFDNLDLRAVMADFAGRTNRLSGKLRGRVDLPFGRVGSFDGWQGSGNLALTDGFVFEFPVFGLFSPILDAISPGLGQSRASEASATFLITNSVIQTDDLEVRSPAVRMDYSGTVDFQGRLNAVVQARVLRDAWVIGPLLNLVLDPITRLFEYKVAGTIANPRAEPLIIPGFLMKTLQPIRSIRELIFPPEQAKSPPPDPAKK
jgi:hypothetical protein